MSLANQLSRKYSESPPSGSNYSLQVPGSERSGRTATYRHWRFVDGLLKSLDPNVTTIHEMFEVTASRQPARKCLGSRPYDKATKSWGNYEWLTYGEVQKRRADFGAGIVQINKDAGVQDQKYGVGLWCQNRPEWQITDLACMSQSLFSVSLYDTLGPTAIEYIINHASLPCVATSLPHVASLLKLKPRLPALKVIISLDPVDLSEQEGFSKLDILNSLGSEMGVKVYTIEQVEEIGRANGQPICCPPIPSDIVTINYTSGTTGPPKGVVLSHVAAVAAASASLAFSYQGPTDRFISYLPLAHIYGRMIEHGGLWAGGAIGYFHGDVLAIVDDFQQVRPTMFTSVPRLYNRFGGAIRANTVDKPGVGGAIARHIISTKTAALKPAESPSATYKHAFYDRIWGRKVAAALGLDKARVLVSGSAPYDPSLQTFFRAAFGKIVIQGYGLTETYAHGFCQFEDDLTTGNVGGVAPCIEVCLQDVPDMDYYSTDKPRPRGEILIRGNSLFNGYFRDEEETKKAMTDDGWFQTGDIGAVDRRGRFQIIDRKKNVLKLAHGEYVSPERIENVYLSHLNYLAMAFVHGDSLQTFLVAIFAIQPDIFAPFASTVLGRTIEATDTQAIAAACKDDKIRSAVLRDIDSVGRKNRFAGFERVRKLVLMVDPFTLDNELLTPTLKLKRSPTAKMYRKQLDDLYAEALAEEENTVQKRAKL